MEQGFIQLVEESCREHRLSSEIHPIWTLPPVNFDAGCIRAIRGAVELLGLSSIDVVSGAAHDVAYIARIAPTSMIFIPSTGGFSHSARESSEWSHCVNGADALLNTVLRLAEAACRNV